MDKASYFDLQYRAGLTINCLTRMIDKEQDYLPYFDIIYHAKPPLAQHIRWDYGDGTGRYVDALSLMRAMTGSNYDADIDDKLTRLMLSFLGPKGLSWWKQSPYLTSHPSDQPGTVAELCWSQASTFNAMITLFLSTGNDLYKEKAKQLVDGIAEVSLLKNGMRYYPLEAKKVGRADDILYPPHGWSEYQISRSGAFGANVGVIIRPLIRFYKETGYEPAAELACGFSEYILRETKLYREDGRFHDMLEGHFYARVCSALGILQTGLILNKPEYVKLAENVYKHAKEWGTSFGWFPEDLSSTQGGETCCITEMIETAITLGRYVNPVYWNDAECFGRNQLFENQLLKVDWTDKVLEYPSRIPPFDSLRITRENVMERVLGGFAGWSLVNDWVTLDERHAHMMACCNAHGARALYDLWHYSITGSQDELSVNMLFTRASRFLDIRSSLPYKGKVEIHIKNDSSLRIRIPSYVDGDNLRVSLNGSQAVCECKGDWIRLGNLQKEDNVLLLFNLPEREEEVFLGYNDYKVRYRADTVMNIEPHGSVYPLYNRSELIGKGDSDYLPPSNENCVEFESIVGV